MKTVISILVAALVCALAYAAVFLYQRSKVALIIDAVGKLVFERGYCPDSYSVAGYRDGWFAIGMDGNIGYVREEYVWWDAIDTN